ncbi:uncharacterized protein LOC114291560 [Camellia sinensis]|uniref:uncharacterized protein LOC114291560 n=1 Tax=Camellia sinensis TaxID=4442 RepID=UPI001036057A|nr:uncharacterized protein LOC114291560 [Camellia sinensis]
MVANESIKLRLILMVLSSDIKLAWLLRVSCKSMMDVKNVFLNGHLTEKVYMHPLTGLLHSSRQVASSPKGYFLSQVKYANEVIHRAGLTATKVSDTPIELNVKLNSTNSVHLDNPTFYRELMGCLVYLTITRIDLAYVVHVGLLLSSTSSLDLVAYVDSDWASDVNDRKSTSGFYMFLDDPLIS